MTALTPIAPPSLTTLTISPELWRLLATGPSSQIEEIASIPALRAEAATCHRQLEVLTEPVGGAEVERSLGTLVLIFGLGEQAKAASFWRAYKDALCDLPRVAFDRAVAEWQRVGKFFPKPAELRELADPHATALRMAAHRAKKAASWEAPKAIPEAERMPAEKVRALLDDTLGKLAGMDMLARTRTRRVRPPQAKVDETGISAEARALMERQRA